MAIFVIKFIELLLYPKIEKFMIQWTHRKQLGFDKNKIVEWQRQRGSFMKKCTECSKTNWSLIYISSTCLHCSTEKSLQILSEYINKYWKYVRKTQWRKSDMVSKTQKKNTKKYQVMKKQRNQVKVTE